MVTVTSSEFQKNFGHFKEIAQREPIMVTSNGRESAVLLSATEYAEYVKLKQSRFAHDGEVTEAFKAEVDKFVQEHDEVLEGLAK